MTFRYIDLNPAAPQNLKCIKMHVCRTHNSVLLHAWQVLPVNSLSQKKNLGCRREATR